MATTRENIGYIVAVTKMMSKLSKIREKSDNRALTDLLEKSEFFQRLANDLTERQELIQSASEHMKYKFYPKGSIIHGYDEPVCSVRAIVKGKAFVYTPRKQEVMKKEYYDLKKSQVIREYIQCIEDQELQEKFTQWLNKKEAGTRALRKRMNLLTARSDRNSTANIELVDFSSVVNNILEDKSSLLPSHLRDYDITAKEKLLLLAHFGMMGKYMQDGVFTLEVTREMQPGDSYGEISLLKASTFEGVIVAAEDVHLISFARDDYRSLFTKDIKNLQNKIEFLTKMFSDISKASIIKIAYYLEEKVLMSRETLYKEGEEAKAIYFVRKGEMQLSVQKVKSSKNLLKADSKSKSLERFNTKHQRIIVGSLQPGTMFGEEDVIERIPRKYTAMATQPHTFVYVLRREVFTEIFEKHTPHIAAVFQDWMKVKSIWRNQRIGTEQELMSQQEPEIANPYAMEIKSPTAQDSQQKFYTPKRETFIAHTEHGDVPEFQERVTFRVLPSSKATQDLNPATPRGNSSQSNTEYQLFDRIQLDKISLSSRKPIKRIPIKPGKETPRKEPQSARQSGSISTIPSLGDLTLPKPSESRPVKVRTLNNELVSAETRFPRKIKTLLSVDRDNVDIAALPRPFTGSLKSARVKSYNNLPDGSSPYMMTTTTLTTLNGMSTTNISQKKSGTDNSKLSRESVKILHRLILKQPDLSEANHTESQAAPEDQFVNFHRREQRIQGDSNRTSVKRIESRENSLSRLPKSEYSLNIIHDEKLRLRTTMGSIRNMIGAKRTNTVSVKNLEFGL